MRNIKRLFEQSGIYGKYTSLIQYESNGVRWYSNYGSKRTYFLSLGGSYLYNYTGWMDNEKFI